jgi:26S proteasome regulatory subunit N2
LFFSSFQEWAFLKRRKKKRAYMFAFQMFQSKINRMGAIMATGIIDAGGRNARVQLLTSGGRLRKTTAVGLAMFVQYWYWYPLSYFFGVALTPSALIAVDPKELKTPRIELSCECRASLFKHPEPVAAPAATTAKRAAAAVLSTTARAAARARDRERAKGASAAAPMDEEEKGAAAAAEGKGQGKEERKKLEEPAHYALYNPARVAPAQARFVRWPKGGRWVPVPPARGGAAPALGFVVVRDRSPGEAVEYAAGGGAPGAAPAVAGAAAGGATGAEAAPAAAEPAPPAAIDLATA